MESLKTELPTFSVIIPVYNKGPHIERCIQSVLNQKYKDYEIIVVHDPSTDNSLQEIKKFDKYIRLFERSEPGPGGYAARNVGIQNARGKWIAFLDADDEWLENHLEVRAGLIDRFSNSDVLSSGWIQHYGNGEQVYDNYFIGNREKGDHLYGLETYISKYRPIWTAVSTVRKTMFDEVGYFDESWSHGADKEMWIRLFLNGAKGAWASEATAIYHRDSVHMVTSSFFQSKSPTSDTIRKFLNKNENHPLEINLKRNANIESTKAILRGGLTRDIKLRDGLRQIYTERKVLGLKLDQWGRFSLIVIYCSIPKSIKEMILNILNKYYNL